MAEKHKDDRNNFSRRGKVARYRTAQFSWDSGESSASEVDCPFNGVVYAFATIINNNTNNVTATVAFQDEDDISIYSLAAIAENATTVTRLTAGTEIYVPDGCAIVVTPSGDPGESGLTVDVVFYYV